MNYLKHYIKLIRKSQKRTLIEGIYYENHHIFPLSLFGNNNKTVKLTAKEHFIVHFLLWKRYKKIYGLNHWRTHKMGFAFYKMTITSKSSQKRYTSRSYEIAKKWYLINNPVKSEEVRRKISETQKKQYKEGRMHPLLGKPCSDETKKKISLATKGKLSGELNPSKRPEVREKISKARKGISSDKLKLGKHPRSKLTNEQRIKIIMLWKNHKGSLYEFATTLSIKYNVSKGAIQGIVYPEERLNKNIKDLNIIFSS